MGICVSVNPLQLERHRPLGWYHECSMPSSDLDSAKNLFLSVNSQPQVLRMRTQHVFGKHNSIHSSVSALPNMRVRNEGLSSWGLSYLMRAYRSPFIPSQQNALCVLSCISCYTSTGDSTQPHLKCLKRETI